MQTSPDGTHASEQDTLNIEEAIRFDEALQTAAELLRKENLSKRYFRTAVEELLEHCFPNFDAQIRTVVDQLVGRGVPAARAKEVAAIFRENAPDSAPSTSSTGLLETASSLITLDRLQDHLHILLEGAPNG